MKNKQRKTPKSPRTANVSNEEICNLKTTVIESKRSWMLVTAQGIHIQNQVKGQQSTGRVLLTRREFNKFVDWYNKIQK